MFARRIVQLIFLCFVWSHGVQLHSQSTFDISLHNGEELTAAAYVSSTGSIAFFSDSKLFFYDASQPPSSPEWFSAEGLDHITAAVDNGDDELLVFDGASFLRMQPSTGTLLSEWQQWTGLPAQWRNKLTAAVKWSNVEVLLFNGNDYVLYDYEQQAYTNEGSIVGWPGWPEHWQGTIDAVTDREDGYLYFFNDGEVAPYSLEEQTFYNPLPLTSKIAVSETKAPGNHMETMSAPINSRCPTGNPSGLGYDALQSKLSGNADGSFIETNFESGYKVSEIKVYTSKIWGKPVICGLETVLTDGMGNPGSRSIFGKTSSTVTSIKLKENECFKGISGTVGGDTGDYVNAIKIHTSLQSSALIGNKFPKGAMKFSNQLAEGGIFNGFYGYEDQNIKAIGLQYYGMPKQKPLKAMRATAAETNDDLIDSKQYSADSSGSTSQSKIRQLAMGIPPTMIQDENDEVEMVEKEPEGEYTIIDAYIDDYDDYTSELDHATEFVAQPLSGIDWLGAGFDILYYDPLRPNELSNRKSARALLITNSPKRAGNKNQYLKPFGSHFGSANSGVVVDSSTWVTTYQQFTNSFSIGVSPSVEIPKLGKASFSPSYKEMNNTSLGSKSIYMFNKVKRKVHEVELELDWIDNVTGQKYKQKLDRAFKKEIAALPVPNGAVKTIKITGKNQALPTELGVLKGRYYALIQKYGTHIAQKVGYGGQYISRTQVKRSDYERARMTEADFKLEAEAQIKAVKVGNKVDFSISDGETSKRGNKAFRRDVFVQGGDGNTDLDQWRALVSQSLAPVEIYFIPLSDLLNTKMFDDDPNIEKKRDILALMIQKYVTDQYIEAVQGKDDFFRELPDLPMPGNIMVKNGGGYVMWFTVKYEHKGEWETKETGNFTLGKTENIEVPVGAKNITITAEQTTGEIFTETLDTPENTCFKCWGTIFKTGYSKCDE